MQTKKQLIKNIFSGTLKHVTGGPCTYFRFSNSRNKTQI